MGQGSHHDGGGKLLANAQARIADQADDIALVAQQFDLLLLAKAHFPEPSRHLRRGGKLLDANHSARPHPVERAERGLVALALLSRLRMNSFCHWGEARLIET